MRPVPVALPLTDAPLIGREADLEELRLLIGAAAGGTGGTVILIGEGGVGKTRLGEAVLEEARRRGFDTATGRAFAVEAGVPYALFADAFMPLVRGLEPSALAGLVRGMEAELSVALPGIAGSTARPQSEDPAELRGRLLWAVAELVRGLARRQPLLLLLDDVHWADLSSLELLHFLARQTAQDRVLIVCTYNETERMQRPELRAFEQSLQSLDSARVHRVRPLTAAETAELVQRAFEVDDVVIHEFAALLYGWTRGNVFFARETIHSLIDSGRLRRRADGQWLGWELAEMELPGSIREAILGRLQRLRPDARSVAETAAVIGTRFGHEALSAAAGLPAAALLAALDELRQAQVVRETEGDDALRYDFVHPLLRQVLYAELGTARVRLLHGAVAEALEQLHGAAASEHVDELAYHFSRAHTRTLAPKALQYLHSAGRHALERFADREALEYLRLARDRWTEDSAMSLGDLVSDLARAHQRVGEYDAAIRLWRECMPAEVTPGNAALAAAVHRRIAQAYYWSGRYTEALEHYEAGAHLVPSATAPAAEARLRLAAGVCLQELGRSAEAQREIGRAREIAEQVQDTELLARVHRALLLLHIWIGPPAEARHHGARAAELARACGDGMTEFFSEWGLAVLEGLMGHTAVMASHVARIEGIADAQRSPLLRLWTAELAIEMAGATGQWEQGIAVGEHAIGLARSLNQRTMLPRLLVWTSLIYLGRNDMDRARTYIDEAWSISGAEDAGSGPVDVHTVVPAHIGRAAYYLTVRDFAEAIRVSERGVAIADNTGYAFWSMHRLLPILAEAHCHLWDVDGALAIEARIRAEAERLGHTVGLAWADTCRALAVWLGGDPAGATRLMRSACESLEAIPMLPDAARLRRQLAGRLAETGDRAGALQELRRVHEMFVRMGAESELSKARDMFREIGAKPPGRTSAVGAEGLTGRELEIATMVAARKSNKAIGKALDISPRTVSTHVSNIFRKLEVSSRGELADYVRSHGLG